MATGIWDAWQLPASANAELTADGKLTVASATADIGTGTYTIMTQIAAETIGLPIADVTFRLGDSALPDSPLEGGSFTASTIGSAVKAVCEKVCKRLFKIASKLKDSPLAGSTSKDAMFADGFIRAKGDPSRRISIVNVMKQGKADSIEEEISVRPSLRQLRYIRHSHSAIFAEARV